MPRKKKNKKNKKYLILLILLIGVIFALLYFVFVLVSKKETKKETKKESIQQQSIQEEFDEERFCEEEGPEMLEYIEELEAIMDKAAKAMGGRGENLKNWPNWTQSEIENFVAEGKLIKEAYQEVQELSPPEKLTSLHWKMETALSFWREGVSVGNEGFISQDDNLINDCVRLTSKGNDWIQEFQEELREFKFSSTD